MIYRGEKKLRKEQYLIRPRNDLKLWISTILDKCKHQGISLQTWKGIAASCSTAVKLGKLLESWKVLSSKKKIRKEKQKWLKGL